MRSRWMGAVVVVSLALAIGGVAGASTVEKSLPKKTYIRTADTICRQANVLVGQEAAKLGAPPTSDELATFADNIAPTFQQEVDSLKALPKPSGDAKKLKKLYKLVRKGYDKILADPARYQSTSPPELTKAGKQAHSYGFKICGTNKT